MGEGLRDFGRINRRMHNKSWIADNRIALVGGRNLGDEYFTASDEVNFVDLDFAMIGPVVRDVSASFDRFWNSASAWPIGALDAGWHRRRVAKLRAQLERTPPVRSTVDMPSRCARTTASGAWSRATGRCDGQRSIASFPTTRPRSRCRRRMPSRAAVAAAVVAQLRNAQRSLQIISPYFVPGDAGSAGAGVPREGRRRCAGVDQLPGGQ